MNNIVQLTDVKKDYLLGDVTVQALRGVTLEIKSGEFVAMAGPSGSGKTTLLNIIGALDTLTSGKVFVEGQDISSMSSADQSRMRRNKIGFIFQSYNLIPVLTALENTEYVLMLQGRPKKERREIAHNILKEVGLAGMENNLPNQLSGGQQQRIAIARAIAPEPPLILADEPTANVDSKTAASLLDLMAKLHQEKKITFLFSTHDTSVMKRCERLLWLKDGQIEYDGKPDNFQLP
jgi:putative ABC transport system ATP-binding protein